MTTCYISHDGEARRVHVPDEAIRNAKNMRKLLKHFEDGHWTHARIDLPVECTPPVDDNSIRSNPVLHVTADTIELCAYDPEGLAPSTRFKYGSLTDPDSEVAIDSMLLSRFASKDQRTSPDHDSLTSPDHDSLNNVLLEQHRDDWEKAKQQYREQMPDR